MPWLSEKKFFWLIAFVALLMTLIPSFIGWQKIHQGQFTEYRPYNLFIAGDLNVYLSYIKQASSGHSLFENLFTSEPQRPRFFQPLWLILGGLVFITKLPVSLIFLISRLLAGLFFLWVVFRFLKWLGLTENQRKWIFPVVVFSSGFGFFFLKWHEFSFYQYHFSVDLWIGEANTFSSLYHSSLFPLAQALIILIFQFFLDGFKNKNIKYLIYAGLCFLVLSFLHTYDLITVATVLVVYGLIMVTRNEVTQPKELLRYIKSGLLLLAFALPDVFYYLLVIKNEPALAGWLKQNITLTPSLWSTLLGYGLLIPLMIIGAGRIVKQRNNRLIFLLTWLITAAVLIYCPHLTIQRRLTNGLHLALAIPAGLGLKFIYDKIKEKSLCLAWLSIFLVGIFLILTPLGIIVRDSLYTAQQKENYFFRNFITREEKESYDFLQLKAGDNKIIYSHPWTGNILAGFGRRVFLGHAHQTLEWTKKRKELDEFFNIWSENQQKNYLTENNIMYLYYGPLEKTLGPWQPDKTIWLLNVWQSENITIYKIK